MTILGIDPSINCTGWCINIVGEFKYFRGEIKPAPPVFLKIRDTAENIKWLLNKYSIDMVVMERMVYSPKYGDAIANIELGGILKMLFYNRKIPIVLISPTTLKKFITGSGKSKKNEILRDAYRKWKVTGSEHIVEAYALAKIGEMVFKRNNQQFVENLKKYEKEVLKTLLTVMPVLFSSEKIG